MTAPTYATCLNARVPARLLRVAAEPRAPALKRFDVDRQPRLSGHGIGFDTPLRHVRSCARHRLDSALRCADPDAEVKMIARSTAVDAGDTAMALSKPSPAVCRSALRYVQWDRKLDDASPRP